MTPPPRPPAARSTLLDLRRARPEEAAALTALALRAKRSNGYDDAFMAACTAELTVTPGHLLEREYWLAEAAGVLAGSVCLDAAPGSTDGEVHAFFVDPAWQRQGVGRRLWQKTLERATALGLRTLHLDADPFAVPFYRAMGLCVIGETPSGSIPGRMLPKMALRLTL
jgi:GNAT superfamily N-acetyltransferase